MTFHSVAKVGAVPEGQGRVFTVAGRMIAVFLHHGRYYALDDLCPHMGASLAEGHVAEGAVTCPWHAWRFSLENGLWLDNRRAKICTRSYPVRVDGDTIQIDVPESTGHTD
ncbi:MAG: nitrite reductase [Planctomycetaceae bacterium]|nr:MAG: nitrite reductase [Planctomycetaceae bacterium]